MYILFIVLGAWLRLHNFSQTFYFGAELGQNYLAIKDAILTHQLPLLGPPTSHPWLSFGPLFYWLAIPVLLITHFDPLSATATIVSLSLVALFANYYFSQHYFGKKVALMSTLLAAISPYWVNFSRGGRFFSLVTVFFYPFAHFLIQKKTFLAALFLGIMLNFHYSPLVLLPALIFTTPVKKWFKIVLGLAVPHIPFLLYNLLHGFGMLTKFLVWLPYRASGMSTAPPTQTSLSIPAFLSQVFPAFPLFLILLIILFSLKLVNRPAVKYLWFVFILGLVGLLLHRHPPDHYYLPLLPLPLLLFSLGLSQLPRLVAPTVLALFLLALPVWVAYPTIPYQQQLAVSSSIISSAAGRPYTLTRIGGFDYYPGQAAENYLYLLWLLGNQPVPHAVLHFTIHETDRQLYSSP